MHRYATRPFIKRPRYEESRATARFPRSLLGLMHLNADLRFRSGDHALLSGVPHPELRTARVGAKNLIPWISCGGAVAAILPAS